MGCRGGDRGVQFPEFPENFPGIDLIPGFPGKKCLIPGIPGTAIIFGNKLIVNTEETCQRHLHIYALIVTSQNNGSLNMIMCCSFIDIKHVSTIGDSPYDQGHLHNQIWDYCNKRKANSRVPGDKKCEFPAPGSRHFFPGIESFPGVPGKNFRENGDSRNSRNSRDPLSPPQLRHTGQGN